jgi:hypothetical protein
MKSVNYAMLALVCSAVPAFAITVTTPTADQRLESPFMLTASTTTCGGQPAASMGYSIDYGETTIETTSFSALVIAGNGTHILHVKCWGTSGAAGDTDLDIDVVPAAADPPATVPATSNIQSLSTWEWNNDPATGGSSSGSSELVSSPSLSGSAREFSVSYSNSGGEIFHTTFGSDPTSLHFVYETAIWITNPSAIANIEMDVNQVIADGNTVIYGVQCDGYSGTWDYTINAGTPSAPIDKWIHSNAQCPVPSKWAANTWHHVQIAYSQDGAGNVTYDSVILDGGEYDFENATGNSAFSLGWAPVLLTNFQVDGRGDSGNTNAYVYNMTVYHW